MPRNASRRKPDLVFVMIVFAAEPLSKATSETENRTEAQLDGVVCYYYNHCSRSVLA